MNSTPENLWPSEFGSVDVVSPVSILRNQAYFLGQQTRNALIGEVRTEEDRMLLGNIQHALYVLVPALGAFRYKLLTITHKVQELYPARVTGPGVNEEVQDAEQFKEKVRETLSSPETLQIIQSLLAQSEAVPAAA